MYKRFRPKLREPKLQEAFDGLLKVWRGEPPSMMVSNISTPLDAKNLLANINSKAELERLSAELQKLQDQTSLAR